MKYLSDVEIKIQVLKDIKKEIFWLRYTIAVCTGAIVGVMITIAQKIH